MTLDIEGCHRPTHYSMVWFLVGDGVNAIDFVEYHWKKIDLTKGIDDDRIVKEIW